MKYTLNKSFFKTIDTETKAYFLGLLYADGWIIDKTFSTGISLVETDCELIKMFQKEINSNHPLLKIIDKNGKNKPQLRLLINVKEFTKNLINKGLFQNKSMTLVFPNESILPKNLQNHFIRGFFDGDGSVWEGQRKIMTVKDLTCKSGFRDRIVQNVKFNISSNIEFLKKIQEILHDELNFKYTKISGKKSVDVRYGQLEYSGRLQMGKFYDYIYEDSTIYLTRKKEKFEQILK